MLGDSAFVFNGIGGGMSNTAKASITVIAVIVAATLAIGQNKPVGKGSRKSALAKGGPVVWNAGQAKWADFPGLPGIHDAVVTGDPDKGASVLYLKIDPSAAIPWHWHSGPEIIYGDSGTFQAAMFKSDKTVNITSGSYARFPGHMIHKASCISTEPCL